MLGLSSEAQQFFSTKLYADKNLVLNVKQFGQFINRFNYEEDFNGNPVDEKFTSRFDRYNYIGLLFNAKDKRLKDSTYVDLIEQFVNFVVKDSMRINRLSDKIYALAKCNVVFNKVPQQLYLVLSIEKINEGYRWALYDAYAKFLTNGDDSAEFINSASESSKLIPPTSNEVNFSHLRNVFQDKSNLSQYISKKSVGNGLISLIHILKNNDIEFNYVENLKYYIFDIRGWMIEVNEFIRNDVNSGWLISDLGKCNENAKFHMSNMIDNLKNDGKKSPN